MGMFQSVDVVSDAITAAIELCVSPLHERLQRLEHKVAGLEQTKGRPAVVWVGIWRHATTYEPGQLVTDKGSLWLAVDTTTGRPGEGTDTWKLIVKRGAYSGERER